MVQAACAQTARADLCNFATGSKSLGCRYLGNNYPQFGNLLQA